MQQKILITGATSGIGLAICSKIIDNGDIVYAIGRDLDKVKKIENLYNSDLFNFISFDLSDTKKIENLFDNLDIEAGKFDGFVHCAGMEETLPLTLYSPDKILKIYEVNVFSTIELLRIFSKKKYCNDNSSVVLFSSVMGVLGQVGKVGYCSTKAAIIGITKSSALELAKRKIRVNAILPGVVNTPMTDKLFSLLEKSQIDNIINMHPLGLGEVEDIVPIVEFLLSVGSRWITGQSIIVDGGYSIQ